MDKQLNVDGVVIDVVVKRIKNIRLGVYPPDGRVRLSVPSRMNPEIAKAFVVSRLPWIKKHQARLRDQAAPRAFLDGEIHYLFGREYTLRIFDDRGSSGVKLNGSTIELHARKNATPAGLETMMRQWYREELKRVVPALMSIWEKRIGVSVSSWGIRSMRTRWGSCNRRTGKIWISLELARRQEIYVEYVIVHELVHLLERHHNENFKKYMDRFIPEWRRYRKELNSPIGEKGEE